MALTEAQVAKYKSDGFLVVEDVFEDKDLEPVISEIESQVAILAERLFSAGKITSKYVERDWYTRMAAIAKEFDEAPGLFQVSTPMGQELAYLWSSDTLLNIVEQFIGSDIEGGAIWNVRPKVPENPLMTVPWHQDSGYLAPDGQYTAQPACWIPLLDVNEEMGCLQVVRGGHMPLGNTTHHVEKKTGDSRSWYLFIQEDDLPSGEIVTCEMRKGSVLFLHENMPHRGLWNRSNYVRWAIDVRWQRPSDPTGLDGVLIRGPRMRSSDDPSFRPDMMKWATEERKKYEKWVHRGESGSLDPAIDGSWYFARWDTDFKDVALEAEG